MNVPHNRQKRTPEEEGDPCQRPECDSPVDQPLILHKGDEELYFYYCTKHFEETMDECVPYWRERMFKGGATA